jgi:23S rRNA (guanine745-N1)-methyltransferase
MTGSEALRCPICTGALIFEPRTWRCTNGHAFDVAREGYVNLLPVQHKHSRAPGDTPESLAARRAFLDAGHYAPLREALVSMLPGGTRHLELLDVGCGEGYYTAALKSLASTVIGLDIAKPAVRLAAKRHPDITWIVGSGARLPIADASIDIVCSLFTPLHPAEMARVLRPGGDLILATPADSHLQALRAALFDQVEPHAPEKFRDAFEPMLSCVDRRDVRYALHLSAADVAKLIEMTPYAWKARPERRSALLQSQAGLETEAGFVLMRFRTTKPSTMTAP